MTSASDRVHIHLVVKSRSIWSVIHFLAAFASIRSLFVEKDLSQNLWTVEQYRAAYLDSFNPLYILTTH